MDAECSELCAPRQRGGDRICEAHTQDGHLLLLSREVLGLICSFYSKTMVHWIEKEPIHGMPDPDTMDYEHSMIPFADLLSAKGVKDDWLQEPPAKKMRLL